MSVPAKRRYRFSSKRRYGRSKFRSRRVFRRSLRRKSFTPRGRLARNARLTKQIIPRTTVVPDITYTKLRYHDTIIFSADATTSPLYYVYRANSINPDVTGTSSSKHLPHGCAHWALFYSDYLVLGSAITVRFHSAGTLSASEGLLRYFVAPVYYAEGFGTALDNFPAMPEQNRVKWKTGGYNTSNPITIKHYTDSGTTLGVSKSQYYHDPQYTATYNASPSTVTYWQIAVDGVIPSSSNIHCYAEVDIVYYVRWSKRFNLPVSTLT